MALGRRQTNKLDKLERIRAAARDLFSANGFDDTTMREIAGMAGVALGTLFAYASNKRDLLFLVANVDLERAAQRAAAAARENRPLIENLLIIFGLHYQIYGQQAQLSKLVLRELLFYDSGDQAAYAQHIRSGLMRTIAKCVATAQVIGEIRARRDPQLITFALFSIFQADVRRWLATDEPDLREGLAHLHQSLDVAICGLAVDRPKSVVDLNHIFRALQTLTHE